jgi:hypothetical protein
MRFAFLLALAALFVTASAQTQWARYRVWIDNDQQAQAVSDSNLELYSEQVTLGETDVIVGPGQLPYLWKLGLDHKFVSFLGPIDAWKDVVSTQVDDYRFNYLRYTDMITQYETWRAANPTLVSRQQIGTTYGGRAIWAYRVANPVGATTNPAALVITGGIHAREWISPAVCMYITDTLLNKIKTEAPYANIMRHAALYIIPSQNPDGYDYTWTTNRLWRKNRRNNGNGSFGVDLNRNYGTGYGGGGSSSNSNSDTYRGPSAFSEPETRSVRDFALTLHNLTAFIDFHSYGEYIMWPWGYTASLCPDDAIHRYVGLRMKAALQAQSGIAYTAGPITTTLYQASGNSVDYFYSPLGALSMTMELRDTGTYGFELPTNQIYPCQQEVWEAFRSFLFDTVHPRTGGNRR